MKYMAWWTILPGAEEEAVRRFLETGNAPGAGIKRLGQWFSIDGRSGFVLSETDDLTATYKFALEWNDVLEIELTPVIDVEQAAPAVQAWYQKQQK
jgi:hypothetical protein